MPQQTQTSSTSSLTDSLSTSRDSSRTNAISDPLKILFLDVDGVLHSTPHNVGEEFREECWRNHDWSMKELDVALTGMGLSYIGKTPNYSAKSATSNITRRKEILAWIDKHPEINQWVAIDDLNLSAGIKDIVRDRNEVDRMEGHFVRTDKVLGLTQETAQQAINYLQANILECSTEQEMEVDSTESSSS